MKAVVADGPGGPEVLKLKERPSPQPDGVHALVRIEASGVNRADIEVRNGIAPGVRFPRIPGCECAGTVSEDPTGALRPGQKVVAFLGGLGRTYDGSYARFAAVRSDRVFAVRTDLEWTALAALPIAYATAAGVLRGPLELHGDHTLLVRGASSAVGMAAVALAAKTGARVLATTRDEAKVPRLRAAGAEVVLVDDGEIARAVSDVVAGGVDRALDLVGPARLRDSLSACAEGGVLCAVGTLGGLGGRTDRWTLGSLLERVKLTDFDVEAEPAETTRSRLQEIVDEVSAGRLPDGIDSTLPLDDVASAHQRIESGRTCGRIVLEISPP